MKRTLRLVLAVTVTAVLRTAASVPIVHAADSQGDPAAYRQLYGRRWVPNTACLPVLRRTK